MKKVLLGCLLALMAAMLFVPATVADDDGDKKISVYGEVRARWEYLDNYTDFLDEDAGNFNDSFDFAPYRVRVGVKGEFTEDVSAYVEIQNHGAFGDSYPLPVAQSAQDPVLQNLRGNYGTNETVLYQGYIDMDQIGDTNLSLKIGRQEHTLGNELLMGDADWYNGQTFDGLRATLDYEKWDLDVFFYTIAERNVIPGLIDTSSGLPVNGSSDDEYLAGVTAGFGIGETEQSVTPYILYYKNGNESTPFFKMSMYTIGLLYDRPTSDDNMFDWSAEYAYQTGERGPSGDTDISASVFEGWFGASFGKDFRNRFHVGVLATSGQDDSSDSKGFIPLFGDTHQRAGLADVFSTTSAVGGGLGANTFTNFTDLYGGWDMTMGSHNFMAAYHQFIVTEDVLIGEDDLGSEFDLVYQGTYSENLTFEVGVASFMPGDLFGTDDDSTLRGWAQARLRF